jgi:hypothetical protein
MRQWKIFVLLAGFAGLIGFFTPLVEYRSPDGKITGYASAFEIARGVDRLGDIFRQADQSAPSHDGGRRLAKAWSDSMTASRGVVIAVFTPAGLLVLLGIVMLLRDRMGRRAGLFATGFGGTCCAVFALLWQADQGSRDAGAVLGLGAYLLLGAGLGGVVAGLGAIVSPDRGLDGG